MARQKVRSRFINTMLLILYSSVFVFGCGGGGGSDSDSGNSTTHNLGSSQIGNQGGQLITSDGIASITIPQGALDNTTTITIEENAGSLPQGGLSSAYEFKPDGLTFKNPVTIRLKYNPEVIPANISEADLKVAFLSNGSWQTVDTSSVDTVNKVVSASTTHFSTYVVGTNYIRWGDLLGSFNSVDVYSNGNHDNTFIYNIDTDGTNTGMKWQCVEYVNRYYKKTYNLDIRGTGGDANLYYSHASDRGLLFFPNSGSEPPAVGDIIVSEGGFNGHVAIVRQVSDLNITVVQQNYQNNFGDEAFSLTRTGNNIGSFGGGRTYPIRGWLRVPFASVQTQAATSVTAIGAILNGSVNPNGLSSTVLFEWWTSPSLSSPNTTPMQNIGAGTSNVTVNAALTGLSLGTTYYYRVVSQNSRGTFRGNTLSLTTNPLSLPTVQTLAATSVTASGATLNGSVNPNGFLGTAWFRYGTEPNLLGASTTLAQSIGLGSSAIPFMAQINGLTDNTKYYFRIEAQNGLSIVTGTILTFTTAKNTSEFNGQIDALASYIFYSDNTLAYRFNNSSSSPVTFSVKVSPGKYRIFSVLMQGNTQEQGYAIYDQQGNNVFELANGAVVTIGSSMPNSVDGRVIKNVTGSDYTGTYEPPLDVSGVWDTTESITVSTDPGYPVGSVTIAVDNITQTGNRVDRYNSTTQMMFTGCINGNVIYVSNAFNAWGWNNKYTETMVVNDAGNYMTGTNQQTGTALLSPGYKIASNVIRTKRP